MASTVDVLAEAFAQAGTPFVVGHPGGESVELMDALRTRNMRFVLAKQESAGAILASTWGELTGSPGICLATRGPGATNMVNGVAHAFLDRAPLIAITDQYPAQIYEAGLRQRINQLAVYEPIVKWSTTINALTVRQQVRRAIHTTTATPPGPVHFDLPAGEALKEAGTTAASPAVMPHRLMPAPDRASLKEALAMIAAARRPVIVAGLGVLWHRADQELVAFAERLGAPVLTTAKGKGVIPEDHPLRAGVVIGGIIERTLVEQADLIITVGLDAVELQPKPWPYPTKVLALSVVAATDAIVPAALDVIGDLKALLHAFAQWAAEGANWGETAARSFRAEVTRALDTPCRALSPQRLVEVARAVMPRGTAVTADSGASRLLVVQKWTTYAPHEFMTSNGLATMGYAIPAAMGARMARGADRPVVAFTGDGGFLMACAELQTSVQENIPIIVVVFDDAEIGLIRVKQEIKGIPQYGVKLGGLDWDKLAQGFGADATLVETENALGDALSTATKSNRTTVIAARIDPSGYVAQFNALREI